jgi:hypothetical protein
MAHFIPIGMRVKVAAGARTVNTCSPNDSVDPGDTKRWGWAAPTSRIVRHQYEGVEAVSTETLWQGCKITAASPDGRPDPKILGGNWRGGKGKKPFGAWAGEGKPLITNPGEARRKIYLPAYRRQIEAWLEDPRAADILAEARRYGGPVYLRDFDTGQGVDRDGPMSHAWVLSVFLNTGEWPA